MTGERRRLSTENFQVLSKRFPPSGSNQTADRQSRYLMRHSTVHILHMLCFYNKLYFYVLSFEKKICFEISMKVSKRSSCAYLRYNEINTIFYIFHSVHYNSVFVIPTNKFTVLCTSPTHADAAPFYYVTILFAAHIQSTRKNYHNSLYRCAWIKC